MAALLRDAATKGPKEFPSGHGALKLVDWVRSNRVVMKTTRVLLCDRRTGAYVLSADAWTTQTQAAHDFVRVADALRFAYKWALNGVEAVLAFEQPEYNVRVPVEGPSSLG